MMIRKIQYAPMKPGRQPCTMVREDFMFYSYFHVSNLKTYLFTYFFLKVRKDFMFSPGDMELEATLDQQLYHHGDTVSVNIRLLQSLSSKLFNRPFILVCHKKVTWFLTCHLSASCLFSRVLLGWQLMKRQLFVIKPQLWKHKTNKHWCSLISK